MTLEERMAKREANKAKAMQAFMKNLKEITDSVFHEGEWLTAQG